MKFAVIQPAYSMEFGRVDECFEKLLAQLEECDSSLDVIVLPEYSDVPANIRGKEEYDSYVVKNNARILDAAAKAAVRCSATVFVNAASQGKNGYIKGINTIDIAPAKEQLPALESSPDYWLLLQGCKNIRIRNANILPLEDHSLKASVACCENVTIDNL